jgi:hypothetical protein
LKSVIANDGEWDQTDLRWWQLVGEILWFGSDICFAESLGRRRNAEIARRPSYEEGALDRRVEDA